MVKNMRFECIPLTHNHKSNYIFIKFAVSLLLIGLAFRLLFFHSNGLSLFSSSSSFPSPSISGDPFVISSTFIAPQSSKPNDSSVSVDFHDTQNQTSQNVGAKCDIFSGEWIPNPLGPSYTNESCPEIEAHQNCMKNGRPDSGYLYWRWKPKDCELHRFDAKKFLDLMRDKSWAFIGDSISRNHVQSLLCILAQVELPVEVYHDKEYRSKRWNFPSHNFTLSVIWTPFLIHAAIFEDINGVSSSDIQLHLDKLDETWTDQYKSFDYSVFAGGKWFLKTAIYHENDTIQGCHYCPGKNLTELGFEHAYRKALQLIFNFTTSPKQKGFVIFRTTTPDHFEGGEWFSGGTCKRAVPFKDGEVDLRDVDRVMRDIELEEFEKAEKVGLENGVFLKLLDTTHLSLLRPDAHPGPYRTFQPFANDKNAKVQNDCLHWCLPGPIDYWNDLIMEMLVNG